MANNCLDWKSKEVEELAKQVGLEKSTPAFADKVGTLMDNLQMEDESILPTPEQYNQYILENKPKVAGKVPMPQGLLYAEIRLPALWKELFEDPFWIGENNDIDFDKVNKHLPEILDMLGYRIPNEDKYSSLPMRAVGFLPSGSGGAIMMPAEITTIDGSDMDVDKRYCIVKKLTKKNGKLQIEKYLDETNSTVSERKESYSNTLPEARKIRLNYKDRLDAINVDIKDSKLDEYDLKALKFASKDLANQWNDLDNEIDLLTNPTPDTISIYKENGITDLDRKKFLLEDELADVKNDHKTINARISELQENGTVESEHGIVMDGVESVFEQNPALYKIGNQQQYSKYLDSIFPDSKVKDIAYKGSGGSQYFSDSKEYANDYGGNASPYIFNLKNPMYISNFNKKYDNKELKFVIGDKLIADKYNSAGSLLWMLDEPLGRRFYEEFNNSDSIIGPEAGFEKHTTYYIKDISNIYKLGTKEDIDGFRRFIKNSSVVETKQASTSKLQSLYNQKAELYTQRQEEINNLISDEEFNKLSIPQQNTKGARDNERLDIFMGIYTNPYTAKDIMSPGGYETIRKIAGMINKNKVVPKEIFGLDSMDGLTIQNMQGRNLKGIAVSHSAFASKSQYSNLKLNFPVRFDGKDLDSLNGTITYNEDGSKRNITTNFAETVAAAVDNGKDPLLASINYNQHTADTISMLYRSGHKIRTIFAFVNQPIILKAMELVNLGEEKDLLTSLKSIAKKMGVEYQFDKIQVTDFKQKELMDMLHTNDNTPTQGQVLANMIKYVIASKDYSTLISATKSDTKGIGKFMEEGITLMRNVKKASKLNTISGTEEFLLNNGNKSVVDGSASVKDGVNDVFNNNKELSKIGNKQQYSKYIESIFPDSKVKDIVYHGSKSKFSKFDYNYLPKADAGFYFTKDKNYAKNFGSPLSVLLNVTNPNYTNLPLNIEVVEKLFTTEYKEGTDSLIGKDAVLDLPKSEADVIVTMRDNQIHILGSKQDIDGFKKFVKENKLIEKSIDQRFNNMFYKYGVKMPIDEVMSKIYPYINESFSGVKDIIEQQLGYSLTADEAKLVDQMLVQFHTSKFEWYANEDKNNIVKNLPNIVATLKADYSEFVQSDLVKPLFNALVVGKDISMGMNSITFDNTQTASDEQREDIKKAWASLSNPYAEELLTRYLINNEVLDGKQLTLLQLDKDKFNNLGEILSLSKLPELSNKDLQELIQNYLFDKFANDLIRYSFFTTGLNFTPKSISSLIPISMYSNISYNKTNMTDMIYGIQDIGNIGTYTAYKDNGDEVTKVNENSDADKFISQFYKHMYNNSKFVPRVSYSQYAKPGENNVTSVSESQILIIPEATTNSDLYEKDIEGYLVAKSDYISVKEGGEYKLYKNVYSGSNSFLAFNRVGLLGVPKLVYELDANNTGKSIIEKNNISELNKDAAIPTQEEIEQRKEACK